jgi:hypothetical protein
VKAARYKLWLMLAVAIVVGGAIAHSALAGHASKPERTKAALTPAQRAARKKLLATADFLQKNKLSCGCRHHFADPQP